MASRANEPNGPSFGISGLTGFGKDAGPAPRKCRFPMWGDCPPTHRYCQKPVKPGSPYCEKHDTRCHQAGTAVERSTLPDWKMRKA